MRTILFSISLIYCTILQAIELPFYFTSHMVMQAGKPVSVRGTARPGKTVKLVFGQHRLSTKAGSDGSFCIVLPAMDYEAEGRTLTISQGNDVVTIEDVTIGDVWLCSGQSNMWMPLGQVRGLYEKEIKHDEGMRMLRLNPSKTIYHEPYSHAMLDSISRMQYWAPTEWYAADDDARINDFSAVGFFFGQMLRKHTSHPIGLIQTAVGGAPLEAFVDSATLERVVPEYLVTDFAHNDLIQDWIRYRTFKNCELADDPQSHPHPYKAGYQYCVGVRPLCDFPISGVVWYQGESNACQVAAYELLFPALVDSWRKAWDNPLMPFYTVQLSSMDRELWADFRNMQRVLSYTIPNSGLAVSSDLGHHTDVHPRRKMPVGERLARLALHRTYGLDIEDQGPTFVRMEPTSSLLNAQQRDGLQTEGLYRRYRKEYPDLTAVLVLSHAKGLTTSDGQEPQTFELAGADGKWHQSRAKIAEDGIVLLFCPDVQAPLHVRYGWQSYSLGNIYNGDNLPMSTFMY